jgi:hypothetical protein
MKRNPGDDIMVRGSFGVLAAVLSGLLWGGSLVAAGATSRSLANLAQVTSDARSDVEIADRMIADRGCPCGCGRYLPGSPNSPACFGCSVGKAEVTRILEGLAAGRNSADIIIELNETILVDVFADYTDPDVPDIWLMAVRVAGEFGQRRVVIRAPGQTAEARRAIELAECAREQGKFTTVQQLLIEHQGPWDEAALVQLAAGAGLDKNEIRECLRQTSVRAQIAKDREHAGVYGIEAYPGVAVNRQVTPITAGAIRHAIRTILEDESI